MASYTVAQLKTAVAAIPAGANAWLIEVPDNTLLPVASTRSVDQDGTIRLLIQGYVNLATRTWTAT